MKKCLGKLAVLGLVFGVLVGFVAVSFAQDPSISQYTSPAEYEEVTGKKISEFSEAPQLAELVEQDELPPVEERLPQEPAVVEPVEEIGEYGGTWRRALLGVSDSMGYRYLVSDPIVRWSREELRVIPNIAKKWEISDEGKVYTFYLRKGIKWSDGEPFTADDIMFWYEDILLNEDLTPAFPTWLKVGDSPCKLGKIDDYTIRFSFEDTYALFLEHLAFQGEIFAPAHYLKQFHPKYTSEEELTALAKEAGFDFWYQLFAQKNDYFLEPDRPVISAWKVTRAFPDDPMIAERNPYYWKVDTEGNQLPYIDRISCSLCSDPEVVVMKALNGEIGMQFRHLAPANWTLLLSNKDKGNYRVLKAVYPGLDAAIYFNMNCKDQVLREIFEDKRFRIALSLALDRNTINQLCYQGLLKPLQAASVSYDPMWTEEIGESYIEYDPDEANRLLDEMGLTERDKNGYRLRSDGETLELTIEIFESDRVDVYELVASFWDEVGIKTAVKLQERSLWTVRVTAGEHQVAGYAVGGILWQLDPVWYIPVSTSTYWAPLYGLWYATQGEAGEEPPQEMLRLIELYEELVSTLDEEARTLIGREILRIHSENLWIIGILGESPRPVVVSNDFYNVPPEMFDDFRMRCEGKLNPEQFFIKSFE